MNCWSFLLVILSSSTLPLLHHFSFAHANSLYHLTSSISSPSTPFLASSAPHSSFSSHHPKRAILPSLLYSQHKKVFMNTDDFF